MVFIYRAAIVALATFVSALIGFGVHSLLPAAYEVESKGMVGSVVGLVGSLLSLVLSLLIWTTHGLFSTQQMQLQTLGRKILELDFALAAYGSETASRRALLREHVKRIQARLWADGVEARRFILHGKLPEDLLGARAFFASLHPENEEQRHALETARDAFGTIVDTQLTMIRSLVDRVPNLLLNVVLGWACLLFFGYGLLSKADAATVALAGLGAVAVGSAVFLILELSDPYTGLFRMSDEAFDELVVVLTKNSQLVVAPE
ncbi:MAG TPA: hypothetical protein VJY34_00410 [Roseiarcus sp.]|nr:hypothetical protein [Roseiarcus sp.]